MKIIPPEGLAADAIVPQCLDNQYTSDTVLDTILDTRKTYGDSEIARLRLGDTHAEFIRSLLYSSTVVVNRAFFVNSDYMLGQLRDEKTAIPALIQSGAIVPYLFTERSLTEEGGFAQRREGMEILKRLESEGAFEGARCVRLGEDDGDNQRCIEKLGFEFQQFGSGLKSLPGKQEFQRIANGLYKTSGAAAGEGSPAISDSELKDFEELLRKCGSFVWDKADELETNKKRFGRQHIYEHFFIEEGDSIPGNVDIGIFKRELKKPSLRMLKKLVDLKYNSNLPDLLGRYTLTPADLPGRSLLPFTLSGGGAGTDDAFKMMAQLKASIMDEKPALPRLRQLNLRQVLEIRKLEEWERFRAGQEVLLLAGPAAIPEALEAYYRQLEGFQERLGHWALEHAAKSMVLSNRYRTVVNLAIQIGVVSLFVALAPHTALAGAAGVAVGTGLEVTKSQLTKLLDENAITGTIKDWSVKLLVQVHDSVSLVLDKDHSFQLELIRSNRSIHRNEVLELIQEVQRVATLRAASGQPMAEQAKE